MNARTWKVGELAKRTALSVRTLHYYEEIGLLIPSARTEAGHRLYTEDDVVRLQRILSMRQLGFALEDIRSCLDQPDYALAPLLDLHLDRLSEQIAMQQRLHQRLSTLRGRMTEGEAIPVTHFLETMEAMMKIENYLTPEQVAKLQAAQGANPEATFNEFQNFVDALRKHQQAGTDPGAPAVQALAKDRRAKVKQSGLADEALAEGLRRMLFGEAELRNRYGLDDALVAYMDRVMTIAAEQA